MRFALSLFAFLWLAPTAAHAESACTLEPGSAIVRMDVNQGTVRHHNNRDQKALEYLRSHASEPPTGKAWSLRGLTLAKMQFGLHVNIRSQPISRNRMCVILDEVQTHLGFSNLDVYVSSEFPYGTCRYNSVLDHEHRHVAIFREGLRTHAPRIREELIRAVNAFGIITAISPNAALQAINSMIKNRVQPLLEAMQRDQKSRNAELDTPENYHLEQRRCSGG